MERKVYRVNMTGGGEFILLENPFEIECELVPGVGDMVRAKNYSTRGIWTPTHQLCETGEVMILLKNIASIYMEYRDVKE